VIKKTKVGKGTTGETKLNKLTRGGRDNKTSAGPEESLGNEKRPTIIVCLLIYAVVPGPLCSSIRSARQYGCSWTLDNTMTPFHNEIVFLKSIRKCKIRSGKRTENKKWIK
jgi:hypothetical protein